MGADPQKSPRVSPQEYYEIDQSSEIKHELIDGQIYALTEIYGMAGASTPHNHITGIESLAAYVMISQNERRVEYYSRDEGGGWMYRVVENDGDVILASTDCRLSLADIYERVEL